MPLNLRKHSLNNQPPTKPKKLTAKQLAFQKKLEDDTWAYVQKKLKAHPELAYMFKNDKESK